MSQAAGRPCGDKCIDLGRCDKATGGCVLGRGQTITLTGTVTAYEVWAPTLELRYIRRQEKPGWFVTTLQQRWVEQTGRGVEWRDIPIVTEQG